MAIQGLDLSKWDAGIDFDEIVDKGNSFVILRGAYSGYGDKVHLESRSKAKDKYFEGFYQEAREHGLDIGVYYYSNAVTYEEGESEAKFLYEKCLQGKKFEYPIYIDVEDNYYQKSRGDGATQAIIGFCEWLENKGYYVGYYCNPSWLTNVINPSLLTSYDLWLAHWVKNPSKKWEYGMWQDGSQYVDGKKRDHNWAYKNYPKIMKKYGFNGYEKEEIIVEPIEEPEIEIIKEKEEQKEKSYEPLSVGQKVKIIDKGNIYSNGAGEMRNAIGKVRYVLAIYNADFPYKVGYKQDNIYYITGYFKRSALEEEK